jgi:hypothetical protein
VGEWTGGQVGGGEGRGGANVQRWKGEKVGEGEEMVTGVRCQVPGVGKDKRQWEGED